MNPTDAQRWKSDVLDQVFAALAAEADLGACLVFKGARVLNVHLGGGRQSLDLDSNLARDWALLHPDRAVQQDLLRNSINTAVQRHFARQSPVRYELAAVNVSTHPRGGHPHGWNAFIVSLKVNDLSKLKKPGDAVRVKDLYDLVRIRRFRDLGDTAFWQRAGEEFRLACRSRFIDCAGLDTFRQQWKVTGETYAEATIPKDIPFAEAESNLAEIVGLLERGGFLPFAFPLPPVSAT